MHDCQPMEAVKPPEFHGSASCSPALAMSAVCVRHAFVCAQHMCSAYLLNICASAQEGARVTCGNGGGDPGKYLAFSYFYDVLPEFVASDEPTVAEIEVAARQVCSSTLKDLKAKHSNYESHNPEFIRRACQVCALVIVYQQGQKTSLAHVACTTRRHCGLRP